MSDTEIFIGDLDKAAVLAALFNRASSPGRGRFHLSREMTIEEAREILSTGVTYYDYIDGRVLKIDLDGDNLETWLYDRDNGPEAAKTVIDALRATV